MIGVGYLYEFVSILEFDLSNYYKWAVYVFYLSIELFGVIICTAYELGHREKLLAYFLSA